MKLTKIYDKIISIKFFYFCHGAFLYFVPKFIFRSLRDPLLFSIRHRRDLTYIFNRVNYYNKLRTIHTLSTNSLPINKLIFSKNGSAYKLDAYESLSWFNMSHKCDFLFGDITYVPETPSIVKSRPLSDNNENSVVLKLDKIRHFNFISDSIPYERKKDMLIFRGDILRKRNRILFFEKYFNHKLCDLGETVPHRLHNKKWLKRKMSIKEQLNYKFVLALEGNDVATSLKWIMSSNSVAVMPRPTCESWFMEGKLIPNYHYIEIKSDYSDVEEKLNYYIGHPQEAKRIAKNANAYANQFNNKYREILISLLVTKKYLKKTRG